VIFVYLKNYFSTNSSSSGTSSRPSTHGSDNRDALVAIEQGEVVQRATSQSENVAQTHDVIDDAQASEIIKVFIPDVHIISDPGFHILLERFHPNIGVDVKRAYLLKGPTRSCGHNFPRNHDNRSFQKHGLRRMIGWNTVWQRMQPIASYSSKNP
jgi:hypothetical protein